MQEPQWREIETAFRRTIARLAHTAYGLDRDLDQHLDRLREAVRANRTAQVLENLARDASKTAVRIQESRNRDEIELRRLLQRALGGVPDAGANARQLERIRKKLNSIEAGLPPDLLREALGLLASSEGAEPGPPRVGLLGRWLGSKPKPVVQDTGPINLEPTPVLVPVLEPEPEPEPTPQSISNGLVAAVAQLLDRLPIGTAWSEQLASLRQRISSCPDHAEAYSVLDGLADLLTDALRRPETLGGPDLAASLPSAGAMLLELVQRLEIPQRLQERTTRIKAMLSGASSATQLMVVIQAIADLLGETRKEIQQERRDLERFLGSVTDRIQNLSVTLADVDRGGADSAGSRGEFHRSLQTQMEGLRTSVDSSEDLEDLKLAIVSGLDNIETHLDDFMQREEQTAKAAEEKIEDLSRRLHDMKHEAFLLQEKMSDQRRQALLDPLTGIPNRMAYDERIAFEIGRWRRYGQPLSLAIMDIDHFKHINDQFGHLAGDKALKALAIRSAQQVREVDMVARFGGEEFVILMPNTTSAEALVAAEKLRVLSENAGFHYNSHPVSITVSFGIAQARKGDDARSLFERADAALYESKKNGRNRSTLETSGPDPEKDLAGC